MLVRISAVPEANDLSFRTEPPDVNLVFLTYTPSRCPYSKLNVKKHYDGLPFFEEVFRNESIHLNFLKTFKEANHRVTALSSL